jgi:hypothetical protein
LIDAYGDGIEKRRSWPLREVGFREQPGMSTNGATFLFANWKNRPGPVIVAA